MIRDAFAYLGCACFACILVAGSAALLAYAKWHEES